MCPPTLCAHHCRTLSTRSGLGWRAGWNPPVPLGTAAHLTVALNPGTRDPDGDDVGQAGMLFPAGVCRARPVSRAWCLAFARELARHPPRGEGFDFSPDPISDSDYSSHDEILSFDAG